MENKCKDLKHKVKLFKDMDQWEEKTMEFNEKHDDLEAEYD